MNKETNFMRTVFSSALELLRLYNSQHSEIVLKHEVREIKNNLAWVISPEIHIIQQIQEILPGDLFEDLIASYAFCIENVDEGFNWGNINNEIIERWGPRQLDYIKTEAWKEVNAGRMGKKTKHQSTTWALSKECEHCGRDLRTKKECEHCGRDLRTKKEWEQGQCERCQEEYEEEMYAIYGDEWG